MKHQPVLLNETIDYIAGNPDGLYVDCTLGGGGHTRALLSRLSQKGRLLAIDRDEVIMARTRETLDHPGLEFIHGDFRNLFDLINPNDIGKVDGIMIDLGVSSFQLDTPERGFSFHEDAVLDMRMDTTQALSARDIVNSYSEQELSEIIFRFGEERYARSIARALIKRRQDQEIKTTLELVDIIKSAVPGKYRREKHPARRTFQALRMAVNEELEAVSQVLPQAVQILQTGGRLGVITFHSLEDRIVKRFMQEKSRECVCPPGMPVCTCNHQAELKVLTRRAVVPGDEECADNPRARSAKLRVAQKL